MQRNRYRTVWCTYTLVSLGALTAVNLILTRFLAINIGGFGRIQLGAIARIMAGLWFGPLAGGLCGLVSDLLGCLIQGYAVNPLITLAAILWGVIPALFLPEGIFSGSNISRKMGILRLCAGTVAACFICTLILTTAGLVLINGMNLYAIFPTRLIQFALQTPVYCVLVCLLFYSPVTSQIRQILYMQLGRHKTQAS